jgi:hypothetical protein
MSEIQKAIYDLAKQIERERLDSYEFRELYCPKCFPHCDDVSTIRTFVMTYSIEDETGVRHSNPSITHLLFGRYSAECGSCGAFLKTVHPTPKAALDYWEMCVRRGLPLRSYLRFEWYGWYPPPGARPEDLWTDGDY